MRKVVVNTTPLIALSHVGELNILKEVERKVYRQYEALEIQGFIGYCRFLDRFIIKSFL